MANRYGLEQQRRLAAERDRRMPIQMQQQQGPPPPLETRNPERMEAMDVQATLNRNPTPNQPNRIQLAPAASVAPAAPVPHVGVVAPVASSPARAVRKPKEDVPEPIAAAQAGLNEEQRSMIQRYIALDDEITALNATLKAKRAERAELEDNVLAIIRPLEAPIKTGRTILRAKVKSVKGSLTQKLWTEKLAASGHLKDPAKAEELVKNIYKDAPRTEDFELVREQT